MIKALSLLFFLMILGGEDLAGQEIAWRNNYDDAKKEAYLQNKLLLLYFGGGSQNRDDLDDPRRRMEEDVWKDSTIVNVCRRFVPVKLGDYPVQYGPKVFTSVSADNRYQQLTMRHRILEYPTTIVIDPVGNELVRLIGQKKAKEVHDAFMLMPERLHGVYAVLHQLESQPEEALLNVEAGNAYKEINIHWLSNAYYEKVLGGDSVMNNAELKDEIEFSRAFNYYAMGDVKTSLEIFEHQFDSYPKSKHRSEYLLVLTKLYLQILKPGLAEQFLLILEKEFPDSDEARRARKLFEK